MQDKPHSDFDPSLMDRGWELLQPQLDEVLPVADEDRRRVAYWWWVLGLLFLAMGAGATYWLLEKAETEAYTSPLANTPIAQSEVTKEEEQVLSTATTSAAEANYASDDKQAITTSSQQVRGEVSIDLKLTTELPSSSDAPSEPTAPTSIATTTTHTPALAAPSTTNRVPPASPTIGELPTLALPAVAALPSVPRKPLQQPTSSISTSVKTVAALPKVNYYLSTQLGTSLSEPHFSNWGVGLTGAFDFASKWRLATSLRYHQTWPGRLELGFLQNEDQLHAGVIDEEVEEDPAGQYNLSSPVLDNLYTRQFGLDMRATRRLSPRWRVALGAELLYYHKAYITHRTSSFTNVAGGESRNDFNFYDNEVQVIYDNSGSFGSPGTGEGSVSSLNPRRWQWAAVAGLQYQLGTRWQLGVDWRKQMSTWSEALPELQTQSTVQLRLDYRFR